MAEENAITGVGTFCKWPYRPVDLPLPIAEAGGVHPPGDIQIDQYMYFLLSG
jgi:hypothetical protein